LRYQENSVKRLVAIAALGLGLAACSKKKADTSAAIQTAPVSRQDITIDVEATGVIQPINTVQVRSKASGQIMKLPVSMGSQVKPGDLLAQIDPRQVQNSYNQAVAARAAAEANLTVTKAQLDRAKDLSTQGVITAPELETATLNYANAQSQLAAARTNLENARIALEDATIRAPTAGTVIEKDVSSGQVIASAVNNAGGGTLLMQMADLSQVMDSALVGESDIGHVQAGQTASIKVDAYPNRTFHGTVEKIAPQATVQQSVTMFPVLIHLDNQDRALMPGMNSDVSILVSHETNALVVSNDAVRQPRDAANVAEALNLNSDDVTKALQEQMASLGGGRERPGTTEVAQAGAIASRGTDGSGSRPGQDSQRGQGGAEGAAAGAPRSPGSGPPAGGRGGFSRGGANGGGFMRGQGRGGMRGQGGVPGQHMGLVFVAQNGTFVPRLVMLGIGNYDVTEVISGLKEGEHVAIVTTAMLMQAQQERMKRIQGFMSLPGMNSNQNQKSNSTSSGGRRGGGGRGGF
jgi:HlyD family secretion protein